MGELTRANTFENTDKHSASGPRKLPIGEKEGPALCHMWLKIHKDYPTFLGPQLAQIRCLFQYPNLNYYSLVRQVVKKVLNNVFL